MNLPAQQDTVPWYRQFWPWFIIALPTVVVIASLLTVYIAVSHPDPLVDGDYYRHGLTINERLDNADSDSHTIPPDQPPSPTK